MQLEEFAEKAIPGEETIAKSIEADVLHTNDLEPEWRKACEEVEIIVDCSTSIAVARYLALDVDSPARRISIFLSPSGNDLVVLAEDCDRSCPLDWLEMQYYRFLSNEPELSDHLLMGTERVRYSNGCRDLSSKIPQDLVSLHAALASRFFRELLNKKDPLVQIWRANSTDLSVKTHRCSLEKMFKLKLGKWTICTDDHVINRIFQARKQKLPSETGGVLIGSFDVKREIIYLVDMIPSPIDSTEWPNLYRRGAKGLRLEIDRIGSVSLDRLRYIGEWHSHPDKSECRPSTTDMKGFAKLASIMEGDGLPMLMIIAGDKNTICFVHKEYRESKVTTQCVSFTTFSK